MELSAKCIFFAAVAMSALLYKIGVHGQHFDVTKFVHEQCAWNTRDA